MRRRRPCSGFLRAQPDKPRGAQPEVGDARGILGPHNPQAVEQAQQFVRVKHAAAADRGRLRRVAEVARNLVRAQPFSSKDGPVAIPQVGGTSTGRLLGLPGPELLIDLHLGPWTSGARLGEPGVETPQGNDGHEAGSGTGP
jgi:hypothetical protein